MQPAGGRDRPLTESTPEEKASSSSAERLLDCAAAAASPAGALRTPRRWAGARDPPGSDAVARVALQRREIPWGVPGKRGSLGEGLTARSEPSVCGMNGVKRYRCPWRRERVVRPGGWRLVNMAETVELMVRRPAGRAPGWNSDHPDRRGRRPGNDGAQRRP